MKIICKIFLIILFVPLFLAAIIAINIRFQILTPGFWENAFANGAVYTRLSTTLRSGIEQTKSPGTKLSDIQTLTDLVTPLSLQDFISRNIENILKYANGRSKEILVYLPFDKLPKEILPAGIELKSQEVKLADFLNDFNITGVTKDQILMISKFGFYSNIALFVIAFVSIAVFYFLWICTKDEKRFTSPGIALIISGVIILIFALAANVIRLNLDTGFAGIIASSQLIRLVVPPVILGLIKLWIPIGAIVFLTGFILIFVKKSYNQK